MHVPADRHLARWPGLKVWAEAELFHPPFWEQHDGRHWAVDALTASTKT